MPRRRLLLLGFVIVLVVTGGTTFWFTRPEPVAIPTIDVSHADPEVADAIRQALMAVEKQPRHGPTWGKLGMILLAHDFGPDSVHAFRIAEQFEPGEARWPYLQGLTLILNEPDAGLACLERAVDRMPIGQPEPRLRLAELYLERGRLDDAETLIQGVVDRSPDHTHAVVLQARLAMERQQWRDVLTRTEAIRDHPTCRQQVARLRSEAYQRTNQPDLGRKELQAINSLPGDTRWEDDHVRAVERLRVGYTARYTEAVQLVRQGQMESAITILDDLVRSYPQRLPAKVYLAELHIHQGNSRSALVLCGAAVTQDPTSVDGWQTLGMAQLNTSDYVGAIVSFRKVIALKPDHGLAYVNLGLAYQKQGKRAEAKQAWTEALRCRPDLDEAARLLRALDAQP